MASYEDIVGKGVDVTSRFYGSDGARVQQSPQQFFPSASQGAQAPYAPPMPVMPNIAPPAAVSGEQLGRDDFDAFISGAQDVTKSYFNSSRKRTPVMRQEFIPDASYVPTAGLTVAPKGGVVREGNVVDTAIHQMTEPQMPLNQPDLASAEGIGPGRAAGDALLNLAAKAPGMVAQSMPFNNNPVPEQLGDLNAHDLRKFADPGVWTGQKSLDEARRESMGRSAAVDEEFPILSTGAEIGAEIGLLALGRKPSKDQIRRAERWAANMHGVKEVKSAADLGRKLYHSKSASKVKQGLVRGGESAVEGYMIGAMQDNDPVATGMATGFTQLGGGLAKDILHSPLNIESLNKMPAITKLGVKTVIGTGAIFGLLYSLENAIPGGEQNIFNTVESSYDKFLIGAAASAAMSPLFGRARNQDVGKAFPVAMEVINSVPRTAMQSFISDLNPNERKQMMTGISNMHKGGNVSEDQHKQIISNMNKGGRALYDYLAKEGFIQ